jgi:hypothetical protein
MRKDSLIIFSVSIVLTLGIVGGLHYLYLQNQKRTPNPVSIQPSPAVGATQPKRSIVPPANRRTSTPIKCTKSDGSVFWTNAARCEGADLNNRLSFADPVKPVPRVRIKNKHNNAKKNGSAAASGSRKNSVKPIPQGMPVACTFPIGMARKIETRSLSLKADPAESIWKDSYCNWVCEARVENCGDLNDYLKLVSLCPRRSHMSKRSCGT